MAREEHPKEDLLQQASGLADRAELAVDGFHEHIVIGFRDGTAASIYFGEQPAYHWNAAGELRRAYVERRLVKAEQGQLISLEKHRAAGEVQMIRHEISGQRRVTFLSELDHLLLQLQHALQQGKFRLIGQVSAEGNEVLPMIGAWLAGLQRPLRVAQAPQVRG